MGAISVIVVSWNARAFLRDCLLSIRNAGGPTVCEIIVIDNASTDGSAEMVESDFAEVQLIRSSQNLGFARANNLGLRRAKGDYLALINSDVVIHPQSLERLAAQLEGDEQVGLVGPLIVGADGKLQKTWRNLPRLPNMLCRVLALDSAALKFLSGSNGLKSVPMAPCDVEVINGCFWLVRRTAVSAVGELDEQFFFYAEDLDWCKRFGERGWKIRLVPTATATHFGGASSANAPLRYTVEMLRANITYWQKHGGRTGKWMFVFLAILHHALRLIPHGVGAAIRTDPARNFVHRFERDKLCLRWLIAVRKKDAASEIR